MSSSAQGPLAEAGSNFHNISSKQRRQPRSCDFCRVRKSDGSSTTNLGGSCSNCVAFGTTCTYQRPYQKRGPKETKNTTINQLKKEIEALKVQLRSRSICSFCAQPLQTRISGDSDSTAGSVFQHTSPESDHTSSDSKEPPDDPDVPTDIVTSFSLLTIQPEEGLKNKYFGAASSYALASNAIEMKEKYLGRRPSPHFRRAFFWNVLPWEKGGLDDDMRAPPDYIYPPNDLIFSLLGLYFANIHPIFPILHHPSFERSVAEGLHLTNKDFGGTLLAVCALASWYSNDPRVFVDGDSGLSAGWKFASQTKMRRAMVAPTIHEVQMCGLLTLYVISSSMPQNSWFHLGLGIRCLLQRGVHRKTPESKMPDLKDELWKRAFWAFISLERTICLFNGRPMSLHPEDYDLALPAEVDDEYLDRGLLQPPGKPSQLSYFICHSRLCEILGDAFRKIYASKKAKMRMGWDGPEWESRAIADLDSSLNDFLDSLPQHLVWNPEHPPEGIFFDQAAELHMFYNYTLITAHRHHIQKTTTYGIPSFSICANAARTIINTADIWHKKRQRVPSSTLATPVFVSGIILVLYTLGNKKSGTSMEASKDMAQVRIALDFLKDGESRSQPIGRLWELLSEITCFDGAISPENIAHYHKADGLKSDDLDSRSTAGDITSDYTAPGSLYDFWNTRDMYTDSAGTSSMDPSFTEGGSADPNNDLMSIWMAAPSESADFDHYWSNSFGLGKNGLDEMWQVAQLDG
ncbi:fungal-trans domain-containing protein [Favolaschia claudopus]|uniref:Fungal-trans domain-containing protein n=1 Tax=Favolaschia claudopus TaxID=2862362 RepID=A0AAW0BBL7_9AGAR